MPGKGVPGCWIQLTVTVVAAVRHLGAHLNNLEVYLRDTQCVLQLYLRKPTAADTKFSTKGKKNQIDPQIGPLEKRLRNGWRKCQVTLFVSHKAHP